MMMTHLPPDPPPLVAHADARADLCVGSPVEATPLLTLAPAAPSVALDTAPAVAADADDGILAEFALFLREEKRWVVAPMLVTLVALGVLIVFAEGSAIAPFIYTIF
jgi:hypothetical protein